MSETKKVDIGQEQIQPQPARLKRVAYKAGLQAVHSVYEGIGDRPPLPEGYSYAEASKITTNELASLNSRALDSSQVHIIEKAKGTRNIWVGVRDSSGELVGAGTIEYKGKNGEMGEFVVSPEHRGKGLGRAIIDEQLRLAELGGIDSLYIPFLEDTNPLGSFYEERGFSRTAQGELVRGPDPKQINNWQPVIEQRNAHAPYAQAA